MAKNSTLSRPPRTPHNFRRAAILFAGGPAPAANAVISAAAVSFLRDDIEVVGVKHGYSQLLQFGPDRPLVEGQDYITIDHKKLRRQLFLRRGNAASGRRSRPLDVNSRQAALNLTCRNLP